MSTLLTFTKLRHKGVLRAVLLSLGLLFSLSGCTNLSSFLFYPQKNYYQLPKHLGLLAESVAISTEDGETLVNWFVHSQIEPKATILFLHGNGENISTHINSVAWLPQHGYQVFLLDYRGYGHSSGSSTLTTALSDIEDAHRWLTEHMPETPLIIFGQSLGGALAVTYTAGYDPSLMNIDALISESAPASWPRVAREAMSKNWLTWILTLPTFLLPSRYDAEKHIQEISDIPILLMHSETDPVVAYQHGRQLLNNAQTHTQWLSYNGAHIAGLLNKGIRDQFLQFLDSALITTK